MAPPRGRPRVALIMDVRRVPSSATRDLRRRILRPHLAPGTDAPYPFEDDPRAAHFASFEAGALVATATVVPEPHPEHAGFWRVRGVATEEAARGRGLGAAVVRACVEHARAGGAAGVWLNGRVAVVSFYERLGFRVVSAPFDTPPSGLHVRMALAF